MQIIFQVFQSVVRPTRRLSVILILTNASAKKKNPLVCYATLNQSSNYSKEGYSWAGMPLIQSAASHLKRNLPAILKSSPSFFVIFPLFLMKDTHACSPHTSIITSLPPSSTKHKLIFNSLISQHLMHCLQPANSAKAFSYDNRTPTEFSIAFDDFQDHLVIDNILTNTFLMFHLLFSMSLLKKAPC